MGFGRITKIYIVAEEAKKKISGIEAALAALATVGTTEGPEVQLLQEPLRKTKRAAQESPIAVQVAQLESFVKTARKRLEAHDASRVELVWLQSSRPVRPGLHD